MKTPTRHRLGIITLFVLFIISSGWSVPAATLPLQDSTVSDEVKALVRKYFESSGSEKDAAWRKIEATKALKPEQVPELAQFIHELQATGAPDPAPEKSATLAFKDKDGDSYQSKYYAYFTGDKASGKRYPLFLIMHSGGGKKDHSSSALRELTWWPKQSDAIAVAPTCRTDASRNLHWNNQPNDSLIVAMLDEAIRLYPVDTNRIYLLGCSMGGWGGWTIGSLFPDRFAAIVSHSGGAYLSNNPFPMINLAHVPMYVHHGGEENPKWSNGEPSPKPVIDQMGKWKKEFGEGYEVEVVNKNGQGHCTSSAGERDAMMKWLLKHTRDPNPKKIVWKLDDWSLPHYYWLKLDKPKKGPSFTAEIKGNQITIKTQGYKSGLSVFVNDKLVDMTKLVTVIVDGQKKFSAVVNPSLAALVESMEAKKDVDMVFWGKIAF